MTEELNDKQKTHQQRWEICKQCEFKTVAHTCKKCGCFMPAKVRINRARCPIGKW